ncbi:[Heparan sulfate]-glucosamine N-sulfotransferase [Aphelenchoides besseyi]|nr:[Heparan sulfate]-glucosamine N-sulfotransferase [Aphelenchoides besseyi]KAI6236131.1 [Heparan sulfate]-glucosamine N-sulfotransferase [Aphelenchoides besseyi]
MFFRRTQFCKAISFLFFVIWILTLIIRRNQTVPRIRYAARPFHVYQCPIPTNNFDPLLHSTTLRSVKTQQRILLIKDLSSIVHTTISDHLQFLKLPIHEETIDNHGNFYLNSRTIGRYSLIIFANYETYHSLSNSSKLTLETYASNHQVGIISFAPLQKTTDSKVKADWNTRVELKFVSESKIPRIARSDIPFYLTVPSQESWTLVSSTDWHPILAASFDDGTEGSVVAIKRSSFNHIFFGHQLDEWPLKLAFIDVLCYFLGSEIVGELERYVQIDIDDIFVGQIGSLLLEEDVDELIRTQKNWQSLVSEFKFTLGFSGYYYRHGTEAEKRGDTKLIENAKEFLWFPHMWRHNHAQEYDETNLTIFMTQNKEFAMNNELNVSLNYAVAPQHGGVYPIHDELYRAWHKVWEVKVTSTEEYPHFTPASQRRAFVYKNISVLPRQTCGLYTHTLYLHAMPDGLQKHIDSIEGGSLFMSILFNQHTIFMTHQQNFANDRLGIFTFSNLFHFLKCWTNLQLKWIPPVELARRYFEKFPNEQSLLHTDVCNERRHIRMLSNNSECNGTKRVPNVFIVGPQKTGTTALREFLLLHPNVSSNRIVPDGYFEEPQFFGGSNYRHGSKWYRELFNTSTEHSTVVFEKTANYFDNPRSPKAISYFAPNAKIIVILIDPIDRAFSWYQHMKAHNATAAQNRTVEEVLLKPTDDTSILKLRSRCIVPGFYADHLERWLDYFLPSQIVILDGQELRESPAVVLDDLTKTLSLPNNLDYHQRLIYDDRKGFFCIDSKQSTKRRCLGQGKGRKYDPISSELRTNLNRLFEAPNRDLIQLLKHYGFKIPKFLQKD